MNIYFTVLKKFAEFSGRSRMSEFWNFTLINFILIGLSMILDYTFGTFISPMPFGIIFIIYNFLVFLPSLAVFVRRMHDVGKSGWYVLFSFIPIFGTVWLLSLCITEGNPKSNVYGPNPKKLEHFAN